MTAFVAAPARGSVLQPGTLTMLRAVRGPSAPLFSNAMVAEAWDARWRRLPIYAVRRTDGRVAIYDARLPSGSRPVAVCADEAELRTTFDQLVNETETGSR